MDNKAYRSVIMDLQAKSQIDQLVHCIQKCRVLSNTSLVTPSVSLQDKICLKNCSQQITFDVQLQQ